MRRAPRDSIVALTFQQHTVAATVHGRFVVRPGPPERLLIGFHGYAETAETHLDELLKIGGVEEWTVASVQALHPFYTARTQQIVASWMTRLDRELAIAPRIVLGKTFIVREQVPDGEDRRVLRRIAQCREFGHVFRDGVLKRQPPFVTKLHDGGRETLRHRSDAEN